jgi:hypothetical protein
MLHEAAIPVWFSVYQPGLSTGGQSMGECLFGQHHFKKLNLPCAMANLLLMVF